MAELKIKPEFRDLIPKLTDEEFAQLEANILEAGEVKEPIIVWNGYIVDGHHRWYIIEKHPEIPYRIEEMDFENEHAAMAWACKNQLGRRNLSDGDWTYLIGKKYEEEKLIHGGVRANQNTIASSHQSEDLRPTGRTVEKVAEELHIGKATVERAEKYAKGIDIANSIVPGIGDEIRRGDVKMPKKVVRKLSKADPRDQEKAVNLISEGKINEAEIVLNGDEHILSGLYDNGEEVEFTEEDLTDELNRCFFKAMETMKTTRESYENLMEDPEINNRIIDKLIKLHEAEIADLEEEKK